MIQPEEKRTDAKESNYVKSNAIFLILSQKLAITPISPFFYVVKKSKVNTIFLYIK